MKPFLILLSLALAAPVAASEPVSVRLQGRLEIASLDTDVQPDFSEAVIFFRPSANVTVRPGKDTEMRMAGKAFAPGVLAVTAGTRVTFPNLDPILHNAFSTSPQARFDLGFYGQGESRTQHFESPGLIRVYCNVHHGMVGYVMVLDTPYFTQPRADGAFELVVPAGMEGELYAWHPQGRVLQRPWRARGESIVMPMDFNGRRIPRHMNKHGKRYEHGTQRRY